MRPNDDEAVTGGRASYPGWPRILVLGGAIVAVLGLAGGLVLALEVRRTCADSNIYQLVNLYCQHVRQTHPHLLAGLLIVAGALIVGGTLSYLGLTAARRRAR